MTRIRHRYDGEGVRFTVEGAAPGVFGRLFGTKSESGTVDDWVAGNAARCDALGALRMYGEQQSGGR